MMDVYNKKKSICIRGTIYDFAKPRIMGVFNCTPDSFYDGEDLKDGLIS
jgi:dihydropteroate synthase